MGSPDDLVTSNQLMVVKGKTYTLEDIRLWKKEGKYQASPVDIFIEEGNVKHNAEELDANVELLKAELDISLATMDAEALETKGKDLRVIADWVKTSRTGLTSELDAVKKQFTPIEAKFGLMNTAINSRIDELNEIGYKATENVLREYIAESIEASGFEISITLFNDFLAAKRKSKGATTSAGNITSGAKKAIDGMVEEVAKPMREAKELAAVEAEKALKDSEEAKALAERKEMQHSVFSEMVVDKKTVIDLESLISRVDTLFPDIKDHVSRDITHKINRIKADELAELKRASEVAKKEEVAAELATKVKPPEQSIPEVSEAIANAAVAPISQPVASGVASATVPDYMESIVKFAETNKPSGFDPDSKDGKALAYIVRNIGAIASKISSGYGG